MAISRSRNGANTNLGRKCFTFVTVIVMLNACFNLWTSKMLNDLNSQNRDDSGLQTKVIKNVKDATNDIEDEILDEVNSLPTLTSSSPSSSPSSPPSSPPSLSSSPPPPNCTRDQLLTVRSHLNPEECIDTAPWIQKCSLTKKTKCPDTSNWLDEYYEELQTEFISMTAEEGEGNNDSLNSKFIGFSVGCNKGFDALNTLRMGTFDATLDKEEWNKAMTSGKTMYESVCAQNITLPFVVNDKIKQHRNGEVHCFEPMPSTFQQLNHSASSLGYDQKGFNVIHGAVSRNEGTELFRSATKGIENIGLGNSQHDCINGGCQEVAILTIDKYVSDHIESNGPIHILQIDVEGYDGDVLLGASEVLKRVEYLEFEYNWMGSWKKQHLYDMVEMLNDKEFTCYFEGDQRLWRITGCWMQYFDVHHWSNVACVNRKRVPKLATKMENVFQKTLKEDVPMLPLDDENDKDVLSTDPVKMALKYAQ